MMMMVTTSEVWFSVFQRTNSHADGNNQCGVVLSFSKNEPRGQTQDGNSQKIKELVLMWNCGSHKKKKIGQRASSTKQVMQGDGLGSRQFIQANFKPNKSLITLVETLGKELFNLIN